ncbi:MAG: MlaD family protein [Planctomycetes bacterium]|nr:MlaD family protein [Planctomycetota bacterium]
MSRSLSRWQSVVLGMIVLTCVATGVWALARIGTKGSLFGETHEMVVLVSDARDIDKGTPVRIRGVEAGKVVAIEYPEDESGFIRLRVHLDPRFADRVFADATARIAGKGMLGTSFIAIQPGNSSTGPLTDQTLRAEAGPDLAEVTAQLSSVANRLDHVLKDVESGKGTAGKILRDDSLFNDLKSLSVETRQLVSNTNSAVTSLNQNAQTTMSSAQKALDGIQSTLGIVQTEAAGIKEVVRSSKETLSAIRQDAETVKALPIVRNYITDEVKVLVRPTCVKDRVVYPDESLFETGQAVLTETGRNRIGEVAAWLRGQRQKNSDVVVVSFADPSDKNETAVSARELTKKRSEVVVALLKEQGVAKMGTFSSRAVTPVGLGTEPPPYVEKEDLAPGRTEVILFVPR